MVQAADVRRGDDSAALGRYFVAGNRRVVVEALMGAGLMIESEEMGVSFMPRPSMRLRNASP
jgi:hypothetical protein